MLGFVLHLESSTEETLAILGTEPTYVGRSPYCICIVYSSSYYFTTSTAFLGAFPYPKIQKFLGAHSNWRNIHEIATFPTFHIQKRSLAAPRGFSRYNTPRHFK